MPGSERQCSVAGRARSARLKRRSVAVKVARRNLGSGDAVVLVDHATEDVTASDRAVVGSADRCRYLEPEAAVTAMLVVMPDVLVEHRLEMSS